ncbi:MAG: class I SAM-dependent methyltransferase [Bacteriovoracaceae bacterium]
MENNHSHFDQRAASWDTPETIKRNDAFAEAIKKHLSGPVGKMMDFGCGTGLLASHFLDDAKMILGIETSQGMEKVFNERFKAHEKVNLLVINLEESELPCEYGPFDLIMTGMAFHHLKNPQKMLTTFKKLLTPNGKIFIIDLDEEDGSFHPDNLAMGVHHQGFSRLTLENWAREVGFKSFEHELIYQINKNERSYGLFIGVYS